MPSAEQLESNLNDFDLERRLDALKELKGLAEAGQVATSPTARAVNLHAHTFFSFNGYGYSPTRFAWEAYKLGLEVAGIVDFDVLDGVEEIRAAGSALGLKTVAGVETRVFFPEYAHAEINSPGEPGIYYFMGTGFTDVPGDGTAARETLDSMRMRARERNIGMMGRINGVLQDVQVAYEEDVVPLTPKGNATERHLLEAYTRKAEAVFGNDEGRIADYWAGALDESADDVRSLLVDMPKLHELIRKKLMKAGGVGYVQPEQGSFPTLDEVLAMVQASGAIPAATWLDGLSDGESDMAGQLELLMSKGVAALNIIPDRNWNLDDPGEKAKKVAKLREVAEIADDLHLPLVVGTELNKFGQKTVDTFEAPELEPYVDTFLKGARIIWAHTLLREGGHFGYLDDRAEEIFGDDRAAKNAFFAKVGEMAPGGDLAAQTSQARQVLPSEIAAKIPV